MVHGAASPFLVIRETFKNSFILLVQLLVVQSMSPRPVEDQLHSRPDDEVSPEPEDEQPESETPNETDESTNIYGTSTSTTATSSSCESCECLCCSNVSTPHHPLSVDSSKKKH